MTRQTMSVAEFRSAGYLQEVNRLFLHPLGLALEVTVGEDGTDELSGIWDYRADPEGIVFGDSMIRQDAIDTVEAERLRHVVARVALFGGTGIQGA